MLSQQSGKRRRCCAWYGLNSVARCTHTKRDTGASADAPVSLFQRDAVLHGVGYSHQHVEALVQRLDAAGVAEGSFIHIEGVHRVRKISCLLLTKKRKTIPFYNKNVLAKAAFFCYTLANEYCCNRRMLWKRMY